MMEGDERGDYRWRKGGLKEIQRGVNSSSSVLYILTSAAHFKRWSNKGFCLLNLLLKVMDSVF